MGRTCKFGKACLLVWLTTLGGVGCGHTRRGCEAPIESYAPHAAQFPSDSNDADTSLVAPGTLDDLLDLAMRRHPELAAARARVEIALGQLDQAGAHPNPVIGPNLGDLGHRDNAAGNIGLDIAQTIVTASKLTWAKAAAAQNVAATDWHALTRLFDLRARVRIAYFDLLTAQRERQALDDISRVTQDILQAAKTLEKAGAGNRPDVLRAKVELEQQNLKKRVAATKEDSARRILAAAVGVSTDVLSELRGSLDNVPIAPAWSELEQSMLTVSSELQEARATSVQQEMLVRKAEADAVPNVDVSLRPFYAAPEHQWRGEVTVHAALPIHDRNEGNIRSARAALAQARANEQKLELSLRERLAAAYQRFQAAQTEADAYRTSILPDAAESVRLVEIGYRGGDPKYDYTALLQAQQMLFQAQLGQVYALGNQHRAAAEIIALTQQDAWSGALRTPCD